MSLLPRSLAFLLAGLMLAPGCHLYESDDPTGPDEPDGAWQRAAVISPVPSRQLDILFMVDNSGSMAEEQASLAANFPALINQLQQIEGGLPDLHIGVVSSDVGAGLVSISGCIPEGDDGVLQTVARREGCSPPADPYIVDVANPDGTRERNYTGTLAETFSCIAELGTEGCGFEQQLESVRRALDGSTANNRGFLRADAHLLLVLLSDEDDCSTIDSSMFDTSQNTINDPLGPLSSFRCFEFGVVCDDDAVDPRVQGPRTSCRPREDSPYMHGVQEYVDFVRGLKADAGMVTVATIVGNSQPVAVGVNPDQPQNPALVPSCQSASGRADPAVRLTWFAEQFPARNIQMSVCNDDLTDAIAGAATLVSNALSTPCLTAPLTGGLGDLAASCRAFDVIGLDSAAEQRRPLPACAQNGGRAPCVRFVADDRCTLNQARASVVVERGGATPPAGTKVLVECPSS